MPDAVVIGSGPNGLVAANLLADHGWSVAVIESQDVYGGAVRSAELVEPGFLHDCFSAFYPLAAASPVVRSLELERWGLHWRKAPLVLAHVSRDGPAAVLSEELDETCASLDAFAPGDGDVWRRLHATYGRLEEHLLGALLSPFPPVRHGLGLIGGLRPSELLRFARFATLPVRRLGEEEFSGEGGRRLLAGNALHADFAPESAISGFFGWLLMAIGQSRGWPVPEGGSGRLADALVARLRSKGGEVVLSNRVDEVIVRGGRAVGVRTAKGDVVDARRAVLADVSAPALYLSLVAPEHLPPRVLDDIRRFQWDTATIKVDWTLDGPIPWASPDAGQAGTVHVADSVDDLTLVAARMAMGQIPERPFLLVGQQHAADPTRQPAGKETAWAYTHVPQRVRGDAAGELEGRWDRSEVERFADRMEAELEAHAPGFRSLIRGRHLLGPRELESSDANLAGGAINGGTAQLHQQLVFRPIPGLGRADTPVRGLFLASSSAHPGGGVHGACGSNAARAAMAADRRRRAGLPR